MFTKGDNYAKILEEESSKLIKLNKENKDYCKHFLLILGDKMNKTYANLSSELFDIIAKIFSIISEIFFKENDYNTQKKFINIISNILQFLFKKIISHSLFQEEQNWISYIKYHISLEFKNK